jgi:hypothetical protein
MPRRRSTVGGMILVASLLLGGTAHRAPADQPPPVGGIQPSRARTEHKFVALRARIRHLRLGQRTTTKGVFRTPGVKDAPFWAATMVGGYSMFTFSVGSTHLLRIDFLAGRLRHVELTGEWIR